MKNFVQPGNTLDFTAPSGGLVSGQGVIIGGLFGVATTTAAEGAKLAVAVEGVFELPKATGSSLSEGVKAYWTGDEISGTASGNTLVGHVTEAAATDSTLAKIRIAN